MFDTLFHIPGEIAGVPVFGVGLLLGAWCVFGVILLICVARRSGLGSELLSYVPLLALVAAAIVWFLPRLLDDQGLPIRGYGVMMLIAVVTATGLAVWRARRVGIDTDTMISMVFWMFIPGIAGARLFYVVEYWDSFRQTPEGQLRTPGETLGMILNFSEGGLVVYGALIAGMIGMLVFIHRQRLPLLAVGDLLAPSLLLGLAIGRIGCLAHGCCFGGLCDAPWAVTFPEHSPPYTQQQARGQLWGFSIGADPKSEPVLLRVDADSDAARAGLRPGDRLARVNDQPVRNAGEAAWLIKQAAIRRDPIRLETDSGHQAQLATSPRPSHSRPVHPTQVYSAINALLICLFLLAYTPFRRRDGEVFAMMFTVYPVSRFLLEIIRTDEGPVPGTGLSISQNVSLLILVAVVVLWAYILKQPRGTALPAVEAES